MEFQTYEDFLNAPFGKMEPKSNDFEKKYKALLSAKRIYIEGNTKVDDNYFLHLKIGSDSNQAQFYDVVIMFFTDNEALKKGTSLEKYFIKFFSNSPSFIYQYAALYKQNGFLIEMLYEKMDPEYADKLPEKTNKDLKLSYDKSIYAALRYLQDRRAVALGKNTLAFIKRKKPEQFFQAIQDFADVKLSQELRTLDKKIDKELEQKKKEKKEEKKKPRNQTRTPGSKRAISPSKHVGGTAETSGVKTAKRVSVKKGKATVAKVKAAKRTKGLK